MVDLKGPPSSGWMLRGVGVGFVAGREGVKAASALDSGAEAGVCVGLIVAACWVDGRLDGVEVPWRVAAKDFSSSSRMGCDTVAGLAKSSWSAVVSGWPSAAREVLGWGDSPFANAMFDGLEARIAAAPLIAVWAMRLSIMACFLPFKR